MPEQSINEQTRQMMGMPTSGDPAIIDPTTGRPYTPDASMRQQEEITRQAEVKEEFVSEQRLQLPKDLEEEIEKEIRPKARPEGLPNVYEKKTAIDKTLEYGYLLKERQPGAKGKTRIVTGLDERNPAHQKIIKAFFDSAVGGDTGFDPTKQAWCAAFVNHILTEMGADLIESKDPYKRLRANEYKTYGKSVDLENIQEGDIVVFDFDKDGTADHVTFYAGGRITSQGEGQYINVIGGNQGGGEVSIRENEPGYTLDNVAAIRRVTYDGDAYEIAQSHKDSDPIFKTFLPEEHEDYALNLQGNYNEGGDVSAQMDLMLPSADDDIRPEDYSQYKPDDFTGRSFAADSFQETKDRFMDAGKIDVDPDDPAIFTAYKRAVDYLKDTGLAGLSLADTAFKYAVGSVAQVMPTEQLEKRMARDLYSMPEAFGGAAGAKSITQLDDAADAFLAGSKQVAQKLKTEYDPTMVRSFVGATPPTYQEREAPLSLLSGESDSASDEVLDIYNMGLLMFREPVVEFAETLDIPKKGLLGSEFLNRVKKNPSIPETSLQESVIEPSRRYTKDELLRALGVNANTKGTFRSVANISPARIKQFEQYQRQRRDAGFVGGTEIDYFDIPVDVTIGYPGKKFKAHSQHYQDETLVHVRGSIIDSSVPFSEFSTGPTGEIVIDSTRNFPAFDTIIDDDNFLLVEEIQSDLLTKGYVKPKSPFDAAFSEAIEEYDFESPVKYQEAYGDISTDIQKIFKELDEESIYSPELPIQLGSLNSNPFFSPETETVFTNKILDKGYTTFEELKDYIKSQNTSSNYFWGMLSRLERRVPGVSVVNTAPGGKTYSDLSFDLDNEEFEELWETFYESVKGSEIDHEIHMHRYEDFIDDYNKVILKKIKEKGLSKELDLNDLQRLREKYEGAGAKGTLNVGLPPIRKNKQAVDEALKVLIAKAAQQGVDKIVIPPAERIAMARGRELKKDKGDRFYRTYVTDLNKSLKELEDNYPVIVHRDVELPYLSKTDVEDGDPFGMMNEPDFTEIDEDGVALEDIQDLMDADAQDIANIVNPTAEITEPLGDELLPPSKRKKLIKTDNKGTILDISELIDKYKIEQPRQFAKGGVAMNEQMEMAFMQEGGLKDDGMKQDPVSGNEIPNGSMASEVRDDIPAQLSEGEYVVPADVVRYLGVKHFEDLRNQAKSGLQSMEANGRIGGEPVPVGGPQAPTPYMAQGGDLTPDEMGEIMRMAQGGMIPSDPYQQQQTQYTQPVVQGLQAGGFSSEEFMTTPGPFSGGKYTGEFSTEQPVITAPTETAGQTPSTLYGPNGEVVTFMLPLEQEKYNNYIQQGYSSNPPGTQTVEAPQVLRGSSDSDKMNADKKRLQDLVDEQNQGSQLAISEMNKDELLDAYKGAEAAKYVSMGLLTVNPLIGGISRLFSGNQSQQIQERLKNEFGVTELPEVDFSKQGLLGGFLSGDNIFNQLDKAIAGFSLQGTGSTYKPLYKPSNAGQYGNNLQQATGSFFGSEQEAYDAAVKSGNTAAANHYDAINRLRGKKNDYSNATKNMTPAQKTAYGNSLGLSAADMAQADRDQGSQYKPAPVPKPADKKVPTSNRPTGGGQDNNPNRDPGPSGTEVAREAAAAATRDRLDKSTKAEGQSRGFQGSVTSGSVYAGGNRAEGGLMLKKKKSKKK